MKLSAIALLLLLTGCAHQLGWTAQGTVRNVWCHPETMVSTCDVVFEHDSGPLQSMTFYGSSVPLWTGLHAKITYWSMSDGGADHLQFVERVQ